MINRQRVGFIAMALILGTGAWSSASAQRTEQVQVTKRSAGTLQVADAQTTYGIRPADTSASSPASSADSATGHVGHDGSTMGHSSTIQSAGGIRYVSGGIGESERNELNALSSQFNLHLLFATQGSGEYLSAVRVNILDTQDAPVLTAESKGPWFYAQLPPGDYSIEVTPTGRRGQDETQRKTVHLDGSSQARFDFYWKK
ncbi:hypothetical protein CCR95_19580 [Thiocystis minor]|nr:hypothetical protein [Thiocystis minor]